MLMNNAARGEVEILLRGQYYFYDCLSSLF
nr:MAG TPA_asm: hypothetical protein [Caudoviricetes sp.]